MYFFLYLQKNKYEAKRKFLPELKKSFPFVAYDAAAQLMYCSSCSLFHGVTGIKVRLKTIKEHAGMKRIKSDWRSCLSNEMLNCLLQYQYMALIQMTMTLWKLLQNGGVVAAGHADLSLVTTD